MIPRRKVHILKGEFLIAMRMVFKKSAGPFRYVDRWEEEFAKFIGVKYAISVSSGRSGMELILRSLGLDNGDEVIIPAYTLKDLIDIIRCLGLTPIPADIDLKTFNMDPDCMARRITGRTRVILATHLFGTPCQIDKILEIAGSKSIFVIEDCAHSAGAEFKGQKTGSFADAAFFSFETLKPINTYGGGMIVTNNAELNNKIRRETSSYNSPKVLSIKKMTAALFENIFLPTPVLFPVLYLLASKRWNKKMSCFYRTIQKSPKPGQIITDFQAVIGLEKLKGLEERINVRHKKADLLKSLLNSEILSQQIEEGVSPNYYFFVALLPFDAWETRKFLLRHGIDAGIGAEIADDCGSFLGRTDCPNAKEVFRSAIQLPLHEGMSERNIQNIAEALEKLFK